MYIHNSGARALLSILSFLVIFLLSYFDRTHCSCKLEYSCSFPHVLFFIASILHTVLGQCRNSTEPKKLPTTEEEQIYPWDTCAALHDVRLTTLQRYFKDVSISFDWNYQLRNELCERLKYRSFPCSFVYTPSEHFLAIVLVYIWEGPFFHDA